MSKLQYTSTFAENKIYKNIPYEFTIHITPNDDLGKEIESFIYFSKKPVLLEEKKGEQWVEVTTNFGSSIVVEEDLFFRVTFDEDAKIKMGYYCMLENKFYVELTQYNDVVDLSCPEFSTTLPDEIPVNEEVEFEIHTNPNDYAGQIAKVQYIFNSMDSIKRIEQFVDNIESEYNGKYIVVDRSEFVSGELKEIKEDVIKFKVTFFAYGSFKLYVLVDGNIMFTKSFDVVTNTLSPKPKEIDITCIDKPADCKIEVKKDKINFIYADNINNNYWSSQYKVHSGSSSPNDIYCGLQFTCPVQATHYKIVTESLSGIYESAYNIFVPADCNSFIWYFPVARKIKGKFKELDYYRTGTFYNITLKFFKLNDYGYKEVASGSYFIKCKFRVTEPTNITQYSSELLYYVKMILNGCTVQTAIKTYGIKHNWNIHKINQCLIKYFNNFGLFALENGLLHNSNEVEAVNYVIHLKNGEELHRLGIMNYNPENDYVKKLMFETLHKNLKNSGHFVHYKNVLRK